MQRDATFAPSPLTAFAPTRPPPTIDDLLPPALVGAMDNLDVLSRKMLQGKLPGERRSKRRGRSVEFDDFRPYVPGDDLRHIDWNSFGRLDRLFIKLFRDEEDLALDIVLDVSASMFGAGGEDSHGFGPVPGKMLFAARLAMCLAYIGLVNQNRVSVALVGGGGVVMRESLGDGNSSSRGPAPLLLRPMRGKRNIRIIADVLLGMLSSANTTGPGASPGASGAAEIADRFAADLRAYSRVRSGRGIGVVISDFLMPLACMNGLTYLTGVGGTHDTYALQTLTPAELNPAVLRERGFLGDLRLIDAETTRGLEVTVTKETIRHYRAALGSHCDSLHRACTALGVAHMLVRTDTSIQELLRNTLRAGGLLR